MWPKDKMSSFAMAELWGTPQPPNQPARLYLIARPHLVDTVNWDNRLF